MSLVSIVMPFLDPNPEHFEQAIESVLGQTYEDWELILVDDGSGEPARRIAERYVADQPDRMQLIPSATNRPAGVSVARNTGVEVASGEFLAMLDADDVFMPDRLARHVEVLIANPQVAMAVSDTQWWFSWGDPPEKGDEHRSAGVKPGVVAPPRFLIQILRRRGEEPGTCSMTLRRSVVMEVEGFEREWRQLYEDQVFFTKIFSRFPVFYLPGVCSRYRRVPTSLSRATPHDEALEVRGEFLAWVDDYARREVPEPYREEILAACRRGNWFLDNPRAADATRRFWKACRRVRAYLR